MQGTLSNASGLSSMLAPAINEEVIEAEVSFLKVWGTCLHNGPFSDSYST